MNFNDDIKMKIMNECWCNINSFDLHLGKRYWNKFRLIKKFLRSSREDDKKRHQERVL